MSAFFWSSGQFGWGLFALLVFSGLWLLLTDLVWRLKTLAFRRLLAMTGAGWCVGVALIVLLFGLGRP